MGEQKMSVLDVLRMNVNILNPMRIPLEEKQIWDGIQAVLQNEQACIEAMEKEAAAQKKDETPEAPENVIPLEGGDAE